jgi:hypothetical protein
MSLRFYLLSICFYACTPASQGQISFNLTPDTVQAMKPKNTFVMYNYAQFENLTGDSLPMRWVRTSVQMEQNGSMVSELGDWDLGVYDPTNVYLNANKLDSADFVLQPVTNTNDKFILHLYPHNVAGHLLVRFRVFPIANPADSTSVVFDYTSEEISSASQDLAAAIGLEVFPNPASDWLNLRNSSPEMLSLTWVSTSGLPMETTQFLPGETKRTDLQMKAPGLWWLFVEKGGRHFVLPQVVGHP